VEGIEIEGSGRVTRDWQLVFSYSHLNGELTRSEAFPNAVGARLANVPSDTFSLWSVVTLPWKLQVGGGTRYVGSRTASTTAPLDPTTGRLKELPGYWVFDAMLSYPFTQQLSLQVNIYNIANEYYFDQIHPGHIVPGPGRSALFGLGVKL
jgi:catecholate siderophore receptor